MQDITLKSTFRMTREMLRLMKEQGHGVIVNNASVLGWRAQAGQAHYAAAKAGVIGASKALAREVAARGVTVNRLSFVTVLFPLQLFPRDRARSQKPL